MAYLYLESLFYTLPSTLMIYYTLVWMLMLNNILKWLNRKSLKWIFFGDAEWYLGMKFDWHHSSNINDSFSSQAFLLIQYHLLTCCLKIEHH
jgi:hypothetical protein